MKHIHTSQPKLIKGTSLLSYAFFRKHFIFLSSYALKNVVLRFHFYEFAVKAKERGVLVALLVNFNGSQQSHGCPSSP